MNYPSAKTTVPSVYPLGMILAVLLLITSCRTIKQEAQTTMNISELFSAEIYDDDTLWLLPPTWTIDTTPRLPIVRHRHKTISATHTAKDTTKSVITKNIAFGKNENCFKVNRLQIGVIIFLSIIGLGLLVFLIRLLRSI